MRKSIYKDKATLTAFPSVTWGDTQAETLDKEYYNCSFLWLTPLETYANQRNITFVCFALQKRNTILLE